VGKKAGISLATADEHRAQGIVTRRAGIVRNLVGISLAAAEGHRAFSPVVDRVSRRGSDSGEDSGNFTGGR